MPKKRKYLSFFKLWDYETILPACAFMVTPNLTYYFYQMSLKNLLKKWELSIDCPTQSKDRGNPDSMDSYWAYLLPYMEETADAEEAILFWFEIKTLADETCALIAQDYYSPKDRFRLKESSLSSEDLIDFITALYHDVHGKKVMLMRLRSENFSRLFDDKLSDWLSENEDKCVIHDVYHDIRENYE